MAKGKSVTSKKRMRPALTPDARENQLISLAMDRAEQQIRDGTASSQVITHFLKLGSEKSQLELEKLRAENEKQKKKTEALESAQKIEQLYKEAMDAFKGYRSGEPDDQEL